MNPRTEKADVSILKTVVILHSSMTDSQKAEGTARKIEVKVLDVLRLIAHKKGHIRVLCRDRLEPSGNQEGDDRKCQKSAKDHVVLPRRPQVGGYFIEVFHCVKNEVVFTKTNAKGCMTNCWDCGMRLKQTVQFGRYVSSL